MSPPIFRAIVVSALGYLIDVADVHLFAVLRVASLADLGVPPDRIAAVSGAILIAQMSGMLLGAFLWGYLGDRFGRLKVLYGSIFVYSLGTLCCGLVRDPVTYGVLRLITGFGLSGETGAAVTLVAELMPPRERGWGITFVSGVGFLGPVFVILTSGLLAWRGIYAVAGICGFSLLALRLRLVEPEMFRRASAAGDSPGSLRLLVRPRQAATFALCFLTGLPLIYAWSLLNFFSLEISRPVLASGEPFNQKTCLLLFYVGTSCGDVLSGAAGQWWESRLKSMGAFLLAGAGLAAGCLVAGPALKLSAAVFYVLYFALGATAGCWVLFTTVATEQFGTNIRATASITIANLVRGFTVPMVAVFEFLRARVGVADAAALIGLVLYVPAFIALSRLRETYAVDLDYVERLTAE